MNTIKFRIWNPEDKKMVESGATPMMLHSFFEYTARFNTQYEIPYQQFTGLTDKLGKEIYEGDIIKIMTHPLKYDEKTEKEIVDITKIEEKKFEIKYEEGGYWIGWKNISLNGIGEVIGNIFENIINEI